RHVHIEPGGLATGRPCEKRCHLMLLLTERRARRALLFLCLVMMTVPAVPLVAQAQSCDPTIDPTCVVPPPPPPPKTPVLELITNFSSYTVSGSPSSIVSSTNGIFDGTSGTSHAY